MDHGTRGAMAGGVLNRRKCHYKAADALLMYGGYTDTGKKQKAREGLLKWQGGREAKNQTKHKRRGPFGLRRFFVILYNGKIVQ